MMVQTNLNLSMNNPEVVQIHAKQGDSGRLYKVNLKDATEENGTLRILRPDGVEVTADAIIEAGGDAYKGDLVTFDALEEVPLTKCEVTLESSQDLHGQSSPYPSGGGVNLLPPMVDGTYEGNGVKAIVKDGVATLSGTTTSSGNALIIPLAETFTVPSGCYYHLLNSAVNALMAPTLENGNNTSQNLSYACSPANRIVEIPNARVGETYTRVRFYLGNNITISGTYAPMVCRDNTAREYAPYSNICPITGHDEVNVYVEPTYDESADPTATVSLGQTVYGGTLDVVSGKLTVDHAIYTINSFAGRVEGNGFRASAATNLPNYNGGAYGELKCNMFGCASSYGEAVAAIAPYTDNANKIGSNGGGQLLFNAYVNGAFATTINEVNALIPSEGCQIWYPCTETVIDLTPQQISTLLGTNNIWSSGEVEVAFEYDGLLAKLPQDATAVVGRCLGDVNFTNVSTMPFTLNVIPNNQEETP